MGCLNNKKKLQRNTCIMKNINKDARLDSDNREGARLKYIDYRPNIGFRLNKIICPVLSQLFTSLCGLKKLIDS